MEELSFGFFYNYLYKYQNIRIIMALSVKLLRFIGSKWFTFLILCIMCVALPITWHNFSVVREADMLSQFWYIGLVFACNLLGALMAFWKFLSLISSKKQISSTSSEW